MTRIVSMAVVAAACWLMLPAECLGVLAENFDSAPPNWAQINNPSSGNSFGFSNTNNTGGTSNAGEAGGAFRRTDQRHFYVDTDVGYMSTFDIPLAFSGELDVTSVASDFNASISFGYVDSRDTTGQYADGMGLFLAEPGGNGTTQYRAFGAMTTGSTVLLTNAFFLDINTDRVFEFTWDPDGGTGDGEFSLTVSGAGGGTNSRSLTAAERNAFSTAELDSFGWSTHILSSPAAAPGTANAYVDGLQYTAIPEASPLFVWSMLVSLCGVVRSRRKN